MHMPIRLVLHAPHRPFKDVLAGLLRWLPVVAAEVLLAIAFLIWIAHPAAGLHGFFVVYAWIVYGLMALGLLYLWIGSAQEEGERGRTSGGHGA